MKYHILRHNVMGLTGFDELGPALSFFDPFFRFGGSSIRTLISDSLCRHIGDEADGNDHRSESEPLNIRLLFAASLWVWA